MSTKKNRIALTVGLLLAFAALITGLFVAQHMDAAKKIDVSKFNGTVLSEARDVQAFSLTGTDNRPFDNHTLQGNWTFMFFGFTNCGYVCPTTMAELAKTYRILEQNGSKILPQVVMVSIDPERDSLEKLKQYTASFHPNFSGARGDEPAVTNMTQELGIAFMKVTAPSGDPKNYDMQHSGAVMLFNPKGQLAAFFTSPLQADRIARDYNLLIQYYGNTGR